MSTNWKRILLGIGSAVTGVLATALPPVAVIALPVLGHVSSAALLGGISAYLAGWYTKTPGHEQVDTSIKP